MELRHRASWREICWEELNKLAEPGLKRKSDRVAATIFGAEMRKIGKLIAGVIEKVAAFVYC